MASIFSKIIAGELPGHFVWQDELCVAIMTIQPVNPGHVLVIPREEINHWDDLPDALVAHLMQVARKLTKAIKAAFPCERVGVVIAGFEVPHTHVHVMPVNQLADFDLAGLAFADADSLRASAQKITQHLV